MPTRIARATRQRIARLEKLLAHLGVLTPQQLAAKLQQAGGHSAPWLLAARVLASNGDPKFLLNWLQLWDVLRWYAHNRDYDGNIRWSGGFRVEAMSDTPQVSGAELRAEAEKEKVNEKDGEEDWKKLEAAARRMANYGFTSPTFAEMVAKFLLGPDRKAEAARQGKPGVVQPPERSLQRRAVSEAVVSLRPGL